MMKVIIFLLFVFTNIASAMKPRVYIRIPQFFVYNRVESFINENAITNCFEFRESPTNLLLKCWRNNQLVNVNINIDKENNNNRLFVTSLSI